LKGPYAPEHQVYLINRAMDELTYVTSTTGGSIAVDELAKKTIGQEADSERGHRRRDSVLRPC
jgi:hypothetical protein